MFVRGIFVPVVGLTVLTSAIGCEMLHKAGVPGLEPYTKTARVREDKARAQRELFATDRDHKAFFWLLANCVQTGMQLGDVEHAIGEPGEIESDMSRYKSDGVYQSTDTAVRWGPDSSGKSAILFFRDGHLVNFDSDYFKNP